MAITFPTTLDTLTNSTSTQVLGVMGGVGLSDMLSNLNDIVEAIEVKVGVDGSAVSTTLDYLVKNTNNNNVTFSGNLTLSGTNTISGVNAFSGNNTHSGTETFSNAAGVTTNVVSERTADNGVTVDGLNIKDGALNTNNSVVEANITNGVVSAAKIKAEAWGTWAPGTTGWTGATVTRARYIQLGKLVFVDMEITGTSNAADTSTTVPVNAKSAPPIPLGLTVNNSVVATTPGRIVLTAGSTVAQLFRDSATTNWTASGTKTIAASFFYEAD